MKVCNVYPPNARKLCHRHGGDVVRVCKNDMSAPDNNYYLVTVEKDMDMYLTNIVTGERVQYHTSTRCIHYKNAALLLNGELEEDC